VFDDDAFFVSGKYDPATRRGKTSITLFRPRGPAWRRTDVHLVQRPWEPSEVREQLRSAGFLHVETYAPTGGSSLAVGRAFYVASLHEQPSDADLGRWRITRSTRDP
jgi:hypothetical protein